MLNSTVHTTIPFKPIQKMSSAFRNGIFCTFAAIGVGATAYHVYQLTSSIFWRRSVPSDSFSPLNKKTTNYGFHNYQEDPILPDETMRGLDDSSPSTPLSPPSEVIWDSLPSVTYQNLQQKTCISTPGTEYWDVAPSPSPLSDSKATQDQFDGAQASLDEQRYVTPPEDSSALLGVTDIPTWRSNITLSPLNSNCERDIPTDGLTEEAAEYMELPSKISGVSSSGKPASFLASETPASLISQSPLRVEVVHDSENVGIRVSTAGDTEVSLFGNMHPKCVLESSAGLHPIKRLSITLEPDGKGRFDEFRSISTVLGCLGDMSKLEDIEFVVLQPEASIRRSYLDFLFKAYRYRNLLKLKLNGCLISTKDCIEILSRCPKIVTFEVDTLHSVYTVLDKIHDPGESLKLDYLQSLTITSAVDINSFCQQLQAPQLKRIRIKLEHDSAQVFDGLNCGLRWDQFEDVDLEGEFTNTAAQDIRDKCTLVRANIRVPRSFFCSYES